MLDLAGYTDDVDAGGLRQGEGVDVDDARMNIKSRPTPPAASQTHRPVPSVTTAFPSLSTGSTSTWGHPANVTRHFWFRAASASGSTRRLRDRPSPPIVRRHLLCPPVGTTPPRRAGMTQSGVPRRMIAAYRTPDRTHGREQMPPSSRRSVRVSPPRSSRCGGGPDVEPTRCQGARLLRPARHLQRSARGVLPGRDAQEEVAQQLVILPPVLAALRSAGRGLAKYTTPMEGVNTPGVYSIIFKFWHVLEPGAETRYM